MNRHVLRFAAYDDRARLRRTETLADEDERFAARRLFAEPSARAPAARRRRPGARAAAVVGSRLMKLRSNSVRGV